MPQIDVNCPYCNEDYSVEIENQVDGDIEEIDCICGKTFEAEISFSVDCIIYKKEETTQK